MPALLLNQDQLPATHQDHIHWYGLNTVGLALAIAEAAAGQPGVYLVMTESPELNQTIREQVAFFLGQETDIPLLDFPDWETLAYDTFSPHQDIVSARLKTLIQLQRLSKGIVFVPVSAAMSRLCPIEYLTQTSFVFSCGQAFNIDRERSRLERAGYYAVDTVQEHGEFAVRGSIIDVFPMGSDFPIRIELFDEEIDTLRYFDANSQRSIKTLDALEILPAREMPLSTTGIDLFKTQFKALFDIDYRRCGLYQDVIQQVAVPGIEYYLPLFFEHTATLFDYVPNAATVLIPGRLQPVLQEAWQQIHDRYDNRRHDLNRPIVPPDQLYLLTEAFYQALGQFSRIEIHPDGANIPNKSHHHLFELPKQPDMQVQSKKDNPLVQFEMYLAQRTSDGVRVLLCAESAGRREVLKELLEAHGFSLNIVSDWQAFLSTSDALCLTIAEHLEGIELVSAQTAIVAEYQLLGKRVAQARRQVDSDQTPYEHMVRSLTELTPGAPVVHLDHGVGRYLGLETLGIDDQLVEFLLLEYAENAKLYVPVDSLHLISRYVGVSEDAAPLHRLGAANWQKEKRKAAEKAHDVAAELLNIYAARAAKQGTQYQCAMEEYALFSAAFPFQETLDQAKAIADVEQDMQATTPMDRLICGDVGFGKTEVAMRAAFIAVQNGKQVAVLVPTTLLAQQHHASFQDRFADWPFKIEVLSRFKTAKEQQAIIEQLTQGKIDILVGTHKLLQSGVQFKKLGLLVIDEEHRFGVKHKEKLKSLRTDVDILTMTATPIPRTLNMALSGFRDISIISTPPEKRLAIKTFVRSYEAAVVKEAILRELHRGGQVYFLHNEVKSIEKRAEQLQKLVPEARIGVAHGQMRERELELVMADFYHRRHNVLVCTTIIETGIDVPSANTIIIDRADKLGLAQLHQLRGRVGRSHHQAYAFLLIVDHRSLSADAEKRLDAIAHTDTLGAGFNLASQDLEIRGAGEFLGDEQSGQVQTIGFTLFMDMLNEAVAAINAGKTPNLDQPISAGPEINLRIPALIPEDYLPDVGHRLILYKRIANAQTIADLEDLKVEMVDRFGVLPKPIQHLFAVTDIRQQAKVIGIDKIDLNEKGGTVEFGSDTQINPLNLVHLVQRFANRYQMMGADKLKISKSLANAEEKMLFVTELLQQLSAKEAI